ncbi:dynactin subunit 2 isoform X2 [Belonocnema kinseyi]|uniref:dynactin subunit 2 isoform X2 n=1 Tax=Belonocnema kinseyi TaxID=2817044 RepID=UPI00143D69B4|nr:dynactin subunit 2 isoform X2 [Belonocnema kinseyi]
MADPKYADLPGIAYDQADVYETTDLPESEQLPVFSKDDNDSVELLNYNASEEFNKFKGKHVGCTGVDFSDRISHKSRTGYNAGCGECELLGVSEKETPLQRFERLNFEIKDLMKELSQLKEKAKNEEESNSAVCIISQVEHAGKQLDGLKLNELLGTELLESLSDPQGSRLKHLVSQIELFKQIKTCKNDGKIIEVSHKEKGVLEFGVLKYQMMYLPEKARLQEMARIGQLEQRLGRLEHIIGSADEKLTTFSQSLKCQGVLEAIQQLGAKSSLLDSSQLDIVENRLTAILNRMDNMAQKKLAISQDSEKEQKISEMYEIIKKIEAVSHIFPQTVNRMLILNSIHQQADFSKSLGQLEELQCQISAGLESNMYLLKGVQENFTSNLDIIKNNIESLDQRIKNLNKSS